VANEASVLEDIARTYRTFAAAEARGRSPLYEELAIGVSRDATVLSFLARLPPSKRQPNLLLAAVRSVHGVVSDRETFHELVESHGDAIAALMLARRTQTNEPARCATLLPLLAALPQPLALIELGAAAGLCLLPDRYGYDYGNGLVIEPGPSSPPAPIFGCRASSTVPLPAETVQVAWRKGLDLEPVDLSDPDEAAWLEALVWPGEGRRLENLRAAIDVARHEPPRVERGDALEDALDLVAEAPTGATLVVFHSALLPYLAPASRARFCRQARRSFTCWISNEGAALQPRAAARISGPKREDAFLVARNEMPYAWADPHGAWIDWLGP
jgi:hypothetical protein